MLRNIPLLLLLITVIIFGCGDLIPKAYYQQLYAISLSIKSLILCILPLIIFGILFKATVNLSNNATFIILLIVVGVMISSLLALLTSKFIGQWIYGFNLNIYIPDLAKHLVPAWDVELPKLCDNTTAMLLALFLGIATSWNKLIKYRPIIVKFLQVLDFIIERFLKILIYLIPLFVTGFIAKLYYEGSIRLIIKDYALIFGILFTLEILYVFLGYILVNKFKLTSIIQHLSNMLTAAISGFTTMSSVASMPLTILGVQPNVVCKNLANTVVSTTVNTHLIGDCFTIPILAYAILKSYGSPPPLFTDYIYFTGYFILAKFSVAAIPGGGIIVMLPILREYLGFNSEMLSLIVALYILFDPMNTSINILANGCFAKAFDDLVIWFNKKFNIFKDLFTIHNNNH